jgi:hypothetical protein
MQFVFRSFALSDHSGKAKTVPHCAHFAECRSDAMVAMVAFSLLLAVTRRKSPRNRCSQATDAIPAREHLCFAHVKIPEAPQQGISNAPK